MTLGIGGNTVVLDAVACASTAVIYSDALNIQLGQYFGVRIKTTSASGTPDIKIEWEGSNSELTTQNASSTDYVVPDGMSDISSSIADEVYHIIGINPPPSCFGRLKVTGNAANTADCLVTAEIFIQG